MEAQGGRRGDIAPILSNTVYITLNIFLMDKYRSSILVMVIFV
jgi:hypothetical protein